MSNTLPQRLTLQEVGEYEPRAIETVVNTMNTDPDNAEWISHGWVVVTYEGVLKFGGNGRSKQECQEWLAKHGYDNTGDHYHYVLAPDAMRDCTVEPGVRKGVYVVFSNWTKEANEYTALALKEIAEWYAAHQEVVEEAATRREELDNEE